MRPLLPELDLPLVSAVIPTRGRPALLASAIRSALRQTWPPIEVVVVVDGPDPATAAYLQTVTDSRLRVVYLGERCGGSDARNAGVRAARGNWIAFLDDDDEWLPGKIARQMRAAHAMPDWFPVVSCRLIAQSPASRRILPRQPYNRSQPIAEYLFCRKSLRDPGGLLQCSTLLAPRELLLAVPFSSGLAMHQDWDWVIRAASHKGVGFSMLHQPLSIWRVEDNRPTVGRDADWKTSLSWIRGARACISPRAFSWFIAIQCAWRVQSSRSGLNARITLLRALLFEGKPEVRSLVSFLLFMFVPAHLRRLLRRRLRAKSYSDEAPGLSLVFARKPATPVLQKSFH